MSTISSPSPNTWSISVNYYLHIFDQINILYALVDV